MVTQYGMSAKFGLIGLATVENKYLDGSARLNCSDHTAAEIDQEVMQILKESYDKALALLKENRDLMDELAAYLIEKETITGKEFMQIFRKAKGLPEPEETVKETSKKETEAEVKEDIVEETILEETISEEIEVVEEEESVQEVETDAPNLKVEEQGEETPDFLKDRKYSDEN